MKKFLLVICLFLVFLLASAAWYYSRFHSKKSNHFYSNTSKPLLDKILLKADQARQFAIAKKFDSTICFLIDMSEESGKKRFFIVDLQKDSVLNSGLVTHGRCGNSWLTGRKYGNDPGCGCTSLGRYKIGAAYKGIFGLAYKLHGLDSSNSNAFKRYVVLHSHECVPDNELHPYPLCQSDGCPTVSPAFLQELAGIIDKKQKPVLLWIYE
jgi:hypothetical protein